MTNPNNSRNEFAIPKENREINVKQNLKLLQSSQANSRAIINEDTIHEKHRQVFVDQEERAQRYLEYPHETQIVNEIRFRESLKNRPLEMYQIVDKQKEGKVNQENIKRNERIGFVHEKQDRQQVFVDQEEKAQSYQEYP